MTRRRMLLATGFATAAAVAAWHGNAAFADTGETIDTDNFLSMVTGVRYLDTLRGTGPEPKPGQTVSVNYTGWIFDNGRRGKKFDASSDHGGPLAFVLGQGQVIPGWDQGVATMHVGGKRTLIIPPSLAYGEHGAGSAIPGNATLIFDVELLSAK